MPDYADLRYKAIENYERDSMRRIDEARRELKTQARIQRVVLRRDSHDEILRIDEVIVTDSGTIIYVR